MLAAALNIVVFQKYFTYHGFRSKGTRNAPIAIENPKILKIPANKWHPRPQSMAVKQPRITILFRNGDYMLPIVVCDSFMSLKLHTYMQLFSRKNFCNKKESLDNYIGKALSLTSLVPHSCFYCKVLYSIDTRTTIVFIAKIE